MSAKGKLFRLLGGLLTDCRVTGVQRLGTAFRLVEFQTTTPFGAQARPGDKVQVLLPNDDVRTYSPVRWTQEGASALLVFLHGDTPSTRWAEQVQVGDTLRLAGPSRSLTLSDGSITLLGDETSLGMMASYAQARPAQVRLLVEVGPDVDIKPVLAELGLSHAEVALRGRGQARGAALTAALRGVDGLCGITGGGELVQQARAALRAQGSTSIKVKAYWVEGRVGLD